MTATPNQTAPRGDLGAQTRALLTLGLPLVGSHLAQVAITTTDTVMLGWYDVTALAAVSLAGPVFFCVFIVGSGFAWAVMPMVASAAGTEDHRQVRRATRMGVWLSLLFGLLFTAPLLFVEAFFLGIGQDKEVSRLAGTYMAIAGLGLTPGFVSSASASIEAAKPVIRRGIMPRPIASDPAIATSAASVSSSGQAAPSQRTRLALMRNSPSAVRMM